MEAHSGSPPKDPLLGSILDEKYKVELFLGKGGFGRVYKAHHVKTFTCVVLKFLNPNDQGGYRNSEILRFRFEAEVPAEIGRGVVKCLDFYPDLRDEPCLVTEFIDGKSLGAVLEEREAGRLDVLTALRIAVQVAETMAIAHEHRLVHRDLTPRNVLLPDLEPDPSRVRVKIIDWGIAKRFTNWVSHEEDTQSATAGAYEPPESSRVVHPPVDVFSLGLMLYRMLVGRLPEPRYNAELARDFPPLLIPEMSSVPRRVQRVISRCLALVPVQRPRMTEVHLELGKALDELLDQPRRSLQESVQARDREIHVLSGQVEVLTRQEREKESRLAGLAERLTQQTAQVEALAAQAAAGAEQLQKEQTARTEMQQAIARLHQERETERRALTEQMARVQSELEVRQRELTTLRRDLRTAVEARQHQDEQLRTKEAELHIQQQHNQEHRRVAEDLTARVLRLTEEAGALQRQLETARSALGNPAMDSMRPLQEELAQSQRALASERATLENQRGELARLRSRQRWSAAALGLLLLGATAGVGAISRRQSGQATTAEPPRPCPVCPPEVRCPPVETNKATPQPPAEPVWQIAQVEALERAKLRLFSVWGGAEPKALFAAGALCVDRCGSKEEATRGLLMTSVDQGRTWREATAPGAPPAPGRLYRGRSFPSGETVVVGDGALYRLTAERLLRTPIRRQEGGGDVLRGLFGSSADALHLVSASPGGRLFEYQAGPSALGSISERKLPTGDSLYGIWGNERWLWAVGTGGTILRQDRRGRQWSNLTGTIGATGRGAEDREFEKLYDVVGAERQIIACGAIERDGARRRGVLYRSRDAGQSFLRTELDIPCYGAVALQGGEFWLAGYGDHLVRLRDDGGTEPIALPLLDRTSNAKGVWGTDADHVYVVGWDGLLLRRGLP